MRKIILDGKEVGVYHLEPLSGCPAVGVSHGFLIFPEFRNKGYGSRAHAQRLERAKQDGYTVLIATVWNGNEKEIAILKKFGWHKIDSFHNYKTSHDVSIWTKHLKESIDALLKLQQPTK